MRTRDHVALFVFAVLLVALRSDGATSPKAEAFLRGPAQWLMTPDEMRAFRAVATDDEAQKAIDLFWVRRDPTPGTARNEFRDEFETRVASADQGFKLKNKRGSLTDPGKVYVLLGPPKDFSMFMSHGAVGGEIDEHGLNNGLAGRYQWEYPGAGNGLTGPVIFIENQVSGEYKYDLQHGNVGGAIASARQRAIVNPGLTEVPAWAVAKTAELSVPSLAPPVAATPGAPVPVVIVTRTVVPAPVPVPGGPAGVRNLVLTKDAMAINPRAAGDPLAKAAFSGSFATQDDLGYAFQYCNGSAAGPPPSLDLSLTISGESAGKKVHFSAADDDLVPDGMPSLPGCYLVRGSIPLAEVGRGSYELALALTDKGAHQTYDLRKSFKVE
jgi:GWxTD domain-containing protein